MRVKFEDGAAAEAGRVIACDGIHPAVRQHFVKDGPVYSDKILYRGLVPMGRLPEPRPMPPHSIIWSGPGKHVVVYAIGRNRTLSFVGCVSKDDEEIQEFRES